MPQDRKAVRFSAASLKRLSVDLLYDILGSFFFALGVYNFAVQANFAPGGVTGIAIIVNHLRICPLVPWRFCSTSPHPDGLRILGHRFNTFISNFVVNTIFLDLISPRLPVTKAIHSWPPFAGAGHRLAIIYQNKSSTGGSDLLIMSLRKKAAYKLGQPPCLWTALSY